MGLRSFENGNEEGLGLIPAEVGRFSAINDEIKIPHIGFNAVVKQSEMKLFSGLPQTADFYFVHSYRMLIDQLCLSRVATANYGVEFVAAYEHENIFATQFHPEKSQSNGLMVLNNFLTK